MALEAAGKDGIRMFVGRCTACWVLQRPSDHDVMTCEGFGGKRPLARPDWAGGTACFHCGLPDRYCRRGVYCVGMPYKRVVLGLEFGLGWDKGAWEAVLAAVAQGPIPQRGWPALTFEKRDKESDKVPMGWKGSLRVFGKQEYGLFAVLEGIFVAQSTQAGGLWGGGPSESM